MSHSEGTPNRATRSGVGALIVCAFVWIDLDLLARGLGFLQAEDVGLVLLDERQELALAEDGAEAVDVPGVELHGLKVT